MSSFGNGYSLATVWHDGDREFDADCRKWAEYAIRLTDCETGQLLGHEYVLADAHFDRICEKHDVVGFDGEPIRSQAYWHKREVEHLQERIAELESKLREREQAN